MNKIFKGKGCPYEEGFKIVYNDHLIDLSNIIIPPHWLGRWRLTVYGSLINEPGYYECQRFHGDVHDV